MKRISTHFLRFSLFCLAVGVLVLCVFALPQMSKGGSEEYPGIGHALFSIMILLYATVVPFFVALWQMIKLLKYIDHHTAFSELSVKALRTIKYCAVTMTVLYMGCVPLLLPMVEADDAPGLILIGAALACAPIVVAVFAAVLERLLQDAIRIKSENELTI